MENTVEFTQGKNFTSEKFLTKELSITQLPNEFSFNDEIKYGLLSFEKWSKESNKEVGGVLFIDLKNKICLKELFKGEENEVRIKAVDFSNSSKNKIDEYLKSIKWDQLLYGRKKEVGFILLPENYLNTSLLPTGYVIEKGKRIIGDVHAHQNTPSYPFPLALFSNYTDAPPSPQDFTNMIFGAGPFVSGIIHGGNLYLMLRTKETPSRLKREILPNGEKSEKSYMKKMMEEIENLVGKDEKESLMVEDAQRKVLINHCSQNNIALYFGEISDNRFKRVV